MRRTEPVRIQVLYVGQQRHVGFVIASEHAQIPVGTLAFTTPHGEPDVLIPVLLSAGGQVYRASYSPLRADEDERQRLYFVGGQFHTWFPERGTATARSAGTPHPGGRTSPP
ncbi:hypothetical protein V3W47_14375 [Deinococcus sp. YIM 134068]|uniref:hypothetical protein n=1 Tax=Deinococcus lichenicola TaxID=3118910 RepID=UPI002F9541AD